MCKQRWTIDEVIAVAEELVRAGFDPEQVDEAAIDMTGLASEGTDPPADEEKSEGGDTSQQDRH